MNYATYSRRGAEPEEREEYCCSYCNKGIATGLVDDDDNELLPEICNMCGGINIEWSPYLATAYAEGICEGEDATEDEIISAWQYLVNTGLCWKLQGSFGRTAQALIEQGIIVSK